MISANTWELKRLPRNGEVRMWCSVILQAAVDMDLKEVRRRKPMVDVTSIRKEAAEWFMADDPEVGAFRWICDMLGLDFHKLQNMAMTREGRIRLLGLDRRRIKPEQDTEEDEE